MTSSTEQGNGGRSGYERSDVVVRPIVLAGVVLLLVVLVAFVSMQKLFEGLAAREAARSEPNPLAGTYARELPPLPRLQASPIEDLRSLRAAEDAVLSGYGWVDRDAALSNLERALTLAPRNRWNRLYLADALLPAGRPDLSGGKQWFGIIQLFQAITDDFFGRAVHRRRVNQRTTLRKKCF